MRLKYAEDFYVRVLLKKVKLSDVMTSPVVSVSVDMPFRNLVQCFQEHRIRHIPIVNSNNEVVGLMSQRDLYKIQPPHKNQDGVWVYDLDVMDGFILRNVMTVNPFTLLSSSSLDRAIDPMVRHKYGCIPVVDSNKKLCGIITQYDILKLANEILVEGQ
ncbi:MAG: CBS domain-containing protein [Candidatus Omnitrophica bacterium]|nr:CBS domain-containing protein [Candidatus Omnitrophota bacterium]